MVDGDCVVSLADCPWYGGRPMMARPFSDRFESVYVRSGCPLQVRICSLRVRGKTVTCQWGGPEKGRWRKDDGGCQVAQ